MPFDKQSGVYYEVHGQGIPLLLGFPIMASHARIFGEEAGSIREGFLERLSDRYRVLLLDYPGIGRSRDIPPAKLTADRVCSDFLSVADAAGFGSFIYWGYSWGAAAGLQLASRTDRLRGLVVGGWPPLGAQYVDILKSVEEQVDNPPPEVQVVLRSPAQYAQWLAFYRSVQNWPEEQFAASLDIPRLAFAGAEGDVYAGSILIRNASTLQARKAELETMGWHLELIPGKGHAVGLEPETVVPVVRAFLDREFGHG